MKVTLQFYAVVRERLGIDRAEIDVPEGTTAAALRERLATEFPAIAGLVARVALAIDREYARPEDRVREGAVVAVIPPIAGGGGRLRGVPLSLDEVIAAVSWPGAGGIATFTGVVRNESRGRRVEALEYEAYPEMAEEKLAAVEEETTRRWPGVRCAVRHRVGRLRVGEPAVVIAVAAPHRREAFQACAFAIDHLKETVPLWKKEFGPGGAAWVEECVPRAPERPGSGR